MGTLQRIFGLALTLVMSIVLMVGVASPTSAVTVEYAVEMCLKGALGPTKAKAAIRRIESNKGTASDIRAFKKCGGKVSTVSPAEKRASYLSEARMLEADLYYADDQLLFDAGKSACQVLDAGGSFGDIIDAILASGVDSSAGAAVVVAAVNNLCPGHKQFLNNFLGR